MPRREEDADSGEGTSWLVLRHTPVEGLGLLANVLRDEGIHHRYLDLPRFTTYTHTITSWYCPLRWAMLLVFPSARNERCPMDRQFGGGRHHRHNCSAAH